MDHRDPSATETVDPAGVASPRKHLVFPAVVTVYRNTLAAKFPCKEKYPAYILTSSMGREIDRF
jgi:hypothetical protein